MSVSYFDGKITLTLEAAFSSASGSYAAWDNGIWDTGTWGPDFIWADISEYMREFSSRIGRSREYDHFNAGTATVVLSNTDGRFSPENTTGPYSSDGVSGVRPWRPMRLIVTDNTTGTTHPIFYGYTEKFVDEFPGTVDSQTTVTLVDGISLLAAYDGTEQTSQGGGEFAGTRMHRILNNAGWTLDRNIDVSGTTVQATTLADNAWQECVLTADSDGGEVWVDTDGTFTFQHSGHYLEDSRQNTIQTTFTDTGSPSYADISFAYDGDQLVTIAALSRVGGATQTVYDRTAQALFGDHLYSRTDLICSTDGQVASLANRILTIRSNCEKRIEWIKLVPGNDPDALWPEVLGRKIRDRIQVERTVPGTTVTLSRECFVDGIEHSVTPSRWETTYRLSSASWAPTVFDGDFGVWDSGVWDTSTFGW